MPALFVAICLVLGGSSKPGLLPNALLEIISVLFLLWIAFTPAAANPFKLSPGLAWLCTGALALIAVHLIPLPPWIWTILPERAFVAQGYTMLGVPLPPLPLSLDPGRTWAALLALLPPACALLLVLRSGRTSYLLLAVVIISLAIVSIFIGIGQATGGKDSPLYFYASASKSGAKGFFANTNHLATLLLACIPLLAAAVTEIGRTRGGMGLAAWVTSLIVLLFLVLGVFIAGSVAGVLLLGPVLAASSFILRPVGWKIRWAIALALLAVVGASAGTVAMSNNAPELSTSLEEGELDRIGIARGSWKLVKAYWPAGSGVGSFQSVYQLHENPDTVTSTYINHAHNEYLEILIEAGLAGALLLLAFMAWGLRHTYRAFRSEEPDAHWPKAASLALAAAAVHSLLDYPARTLAIAAVLTACCAILGRRRDAAQRDRGAVRE